jgi:dolichol-phosphate mannosyltransferase
VKKPDLSIVIPIFNEQESIVECLTRIEKELHSLDYEIICVDDGSTDNTSAILEAYKKESSHVRIVSFLRNFGHQAALSCGYKEAAGDAVITMDADLQDPTSVLLPMIHAWKNGAKIVYAQRAVRPHDTWFKKTSAEWYYRLLDALSDTPIPHDVGDYRLLDRVVVDFINDLPEQTRFLRGLVAWSGYPSTTITYERQARFGGDTHYPLTKMMGLAFDGIISFSLKPLRLATLLGFWAAAIGAVGIVYAVLGRLFLPEYWVTGWTALFVGVMFIGGVQLITIGIIGEYIGKIYKEVQHRPSYLLKE